MKNIIQLLTLGLFMATLSSCVDAGGYVATGPGYRRAPAPRPYYHPGYNNNHYSHNHPSYNHYNRPAPRPAGVRARVGTRGLPLNVNSNTRLGLF